MLCVDLSGEHEFVLSNLWPENSYRHVRKDYWTNFAVYRVQSDDEVLKNISSRRWKNFVYMIESLRRGNEYKSGRDDEKGWKFLFIDSLRREMEKKKVSVILDGNEVGWEKNYVFISFYYSTFLSLIYNIRNTHDLPPVLLLMCCHFNAKMSESFFFFSRHNFFGGWQRCEWWKTRINSATQLYKNFLSDVWWIICV